MLKLPVDMNILGQLFGRSYLLLQTVNAVKWRDWYQCIILVKPNYTISKWDSIGDGEIGRNYKRTY